MITVSPKDGCCRNLLCHCRKLREIRNFCSRMAILRLPLLLRLSIKKRFYSKLLLKTFTGGWFFAKNVFAYDADWQEKRQQSSTVMHTSLAWKRKFLTRLQLCKKFHQYFNYFLLCKFYYIQNILISHKSRFTVGRLYRCIKLNLNRDSRLNRFSNSSRVQFSSHSQHERFY